MQALYLPFESEFDPETRTYCLSGQDSRGALFGVGAGASTQEAEQALRAYIIEVLDFSAGQGEDLFGDLHAQVPNGSHVVFQPNELLPIRLKLARTRANLRQADMAARLGITQQAYAKLERPGSNPTLRTILQAEQALGVQLLAWA